MTPMPTTRRRQIIRRAVIALAGVVLLLAWHVVARRSSDVDQRIVGTWYCKDSPGYFIKYLADGSYELWGDGVLNTAETDDRWFYRNGQIVRPFKSDYVRENVGSLVTQLLTSTRGTRLPMGTERYGLPWEEVLSITGSAMETRDSEGNRLSWIRVQDSEIGLVIPDLSLDAALHAPTAARSTFK